MTGKNEKTTAQEYELLASRLEAPYPMGATWHVTFGQIMCEAALAIRALVKERETGKQWLAHHSGCAEYHGANDDCTCGLDAFLKEQP